MNEHAPAGGAGPALAAHSKDGSAPGPSPASSATGDKGAFGVSWDKGSVLSEKAVEGVERVKASVREATGNAREALANNGGRAVDRATDFVRGEPLVAMALIGTICLALGVLLGRR